MSTPLKLLSLNIALFEKNNKELADFLKKEAPDIVCLQEVTKRIDESANADLISKNIVDNATFQLSNSFFAPIWILSKFEKLNFHGKDHFLFDAGGNIEFGNYVKTRYPIVKGQNVFVQNHFSYVTDWSRWPDEDYRAVEVVDLQIGESRLRVLNYHGIWSKDKHGTEKTKKACEQIKDLALEVPYPAIICGDFNLFPNTPSIQVFEDDFKNLINDYHIQSTRPQSNELSNMERNVVDYVFVKKNISVKSFQVKRINVSDHLPLICEFEV